MDEPQDLFSTPLRLSPAELDEFIRLRGHERLAGVDEVGRGPLAGPVVAAAVILPPSVALDGVDDSKALPPQRRELLAGRIREVALGVGLGVMEPRDIDRLNILRASLLAMQLAVESLDPPPDALLIDGAVGLALPVPQYPIVKGDRRSLAIAAASIIAKVHRDRLMESYHQLYPQYGFHRHKGYATSEHLEALRKYGCCPIHRRSFRTIRQILKEESQSEKGLFPSSVGMEESDAR
jgi:ribonuclease HII